AQSPHYLDRACSDGLVVASLMWPVFALLIGAGMMANERDRGTHPFLLSQPIPRSRLWLAKLTAQIAVLCIGMLISVGVCAGMSAFLAPQAVLMRDSSDMRLSAFLTVNFFAGAVLVSSFSARPLITIAGGLLVGLLMALLEVGMLLGLAGVLFLTLSIRHIGDIAVVCTMASLSAVFAVFALGLSRALILSDEVGRTNWLTRWS
ncbi:MAG: hypothetical protein FJ272_13060, partial [Planctomycetes bacterium]|nr:hypothetical protein [Planctomycetota bacterium]